jgi:hypothetical protein
MKDRLETELNIGDIVVHINHHKTCTTLDIRRITDFTKCFLILDEGYRISPRNVFKTDDERFKLGESY